MSINSISPFLKLVPPTPFIFMISLILLLIGILVGMFGSAGSVRKYLKYRNALDIGWLLNSV